VNLPCHRDLENAVVAYALNEGLVGANRVLQALPAEAFFQDDCKQAIKILGKLIAEGKDVDAMAFDGAWKVEYGKKAPFAFYEAQNKAPSGSGVDSCCEQIISAWDRRRMILAADSLMRGAQDLTKPISELLESAEEQIRKREHLTTPQLGPMQCARAFIDEVERRMQLAGTRSGIETGFYQLDDITDGLQLSEQTVIGARPGIGKTAIACNIVNHCCLKNNVPTLFISLEMRPQALTNRLFSAYASVEMNKIKRGRLNNGSMEAAGKFAVMLKSKPLWICDAIKGITVGHLATIWRYHAKINGVKLVIIDYLQKITPNTKHEKRTYEVAEVSNMLRALAVESKCALLTLAQLNREMERDKKGRLPKASDLADSSQIERDADCIMMLHRDTKDKPEHAILSVLKQRDGELGLLPLQFRGEFCRFENPAREVEPQEEYDTPPRVKSEEVRSLPYADS
jgi:replicative DNA helicase